MPQNRNCAIARIRTRVWLLTVAIIAQVTRCAYAFYLPSSPLGSSPKESFVSPQVYRHKSVSVKAQASKSEELLLNPKQLLMEVRQQESFQQRRQSRVASDSENYLDAKARLDRRKFLGSTIITAASVSTMFGTAAPAQAMDGFGNLQWELTPINKRTGITVFDAEKAGYNVRFVTYLSRFLLVFDGDCQKWWYSKAAEIPRRASAEEVASIRLSQFGAFAASVEVGLQEYEDPNKGPTRLLESLLKRYSSKFDDTTTSGTETEDNKRKREINEARRQVALLFSLMEVNQPVERITQLLAAIDNGSVASVRLAAENLVGGYAPGDDLPTVRFPQPKAGPNYRTAQGKAILKPTGRILRVELERKGNGFQKAPAITISPPAASKTMTVDIYDAEPKAATAKAILVKNGPNKGQLERIQILDPGAGYVDDEVITVNIEAPELPSSKGGVKALAKAVPELAVSGIEMTDVGSGYAVEKSIPVFLERPTSAARSSNETDAPMVGATKSVGKGGKEPSPIAYASAQAETSSFTSFQKERDARIPVEKEEYALKEVRTISAVTGGQESQQPIFYTGSSTSSSAQLLTLLPAGYGLEYDSSLKRYILTASQDFAGVSGAPSTPLKVPLDPTFGPRGRSPIERDVTLDVSSFLRFCASGAICASGAHFILTPLDVVKTKIQTDPENYPGVIPTFKKLIGEAGLTGFFAGWVPTTIGFFFWGGFSYSVTELLRRYFNEMLGPQAPSYEVPVIVAAATISSFFSVFILCPFEAVRIRSVAQPGYGKNIVDTTTRMVNEEGLSSLFSAVPPFMLKEIPFGVSKFFVFTICTRFLLETFPAAQEDIQLTLAVSLVSGMMGGLAAAIVSNPADATISEMKKAKTKMGPVVAATNLIERGGYPNLMRGLPARMLFYPLITSMQFFVYDAVRLYLGVGADDLKVYLDVLGSALEGTPT